MRRTLAILLVIGLLALLAIPALATKDDDDRDHRDHGSKLKDLQIDVEANRGSKNTTAESDASVSKIGNSNDAASGAANATGNNPGTNEIKNASAAIAIGNLKIKGALRHDLTALTNEGNHGNHDGNGNGIRIKIRGKNVKAENTTSNAVDNWGEADANSGTVKALQDGENRVNADSRAKARGCCDGRNDDSSGNQCEGNHDNDDCLRECNKKKHKKGCLSIKAELNKDSKNTWTGSSASVDRVGNSNYAYSGEANATGNLGGGSIHNLSAAIAIGGKNAEAKNDTTNAITNSGKATAISGDVTADQKGDNHVEASSAAEAFAN